MEIEIILNRPITKLGKIGDLVKVKAGYGINFLFPKGFAVPANAINRMEFEKRKGQLTKEHDANVVFAKRVVKEFNQQWFTIIKRSNYDGSLYGAVSASDVYGELHKVFSKIDKKIIKIPFVINKIGIYDLHIVVYGDEYCDVKLNVGGSAAEAAEAKKKYVDEQMRHDVEQKAAKIRENFDKKDDDKKT